MAGNRVGINNYIMFDDQNSIEEVVKGYYGVSISAEEWDDIISAITTNGVLGDLDATYHSLVSLSNLSETDELRNFPTEPSSVDVRYGVETATLTSGKTNTIQCDIAQHTFVNETAATYTSTIGTGSYTGLGGFIEYTASASDISTYGTLVLCLDVYVNGGLSRIYTEQVDITASGSANKGLINFDITPFLNKDCRMIARLKDKSALTSYPMSGTIEEFTGGLGADIKKGTTQGTIRGLGGSLLAASLVHTTATGQSSTFATGFSTNSDNAIIVDVNYTCSSGGYVFSGDIAADMVCNIRAYNRTSGGGKGAFITQITSELDTSGTGAFNIDFKPLTVDVSSLDSNGIYVEIVMAEGEDFFNTYNR